MSAPPERIRNIRKLFESCRYRHDMHTLFSDFCEAAAIAIANSTDLAQREPREARYLEIVRRYERDVIETFPRILGEVTLALEAGPGDVLGAVFSALELHNDRAGQFFTPYDVCRFMALTMIGDGSDLRRLIETRGFVTAHEPACGAGAMVIALAEAMRAKGFHYQRQLYVEAIDIDRRAAHMAFIQLSLMHIPAVVIVGNSLSLEERERWYTPAYILGGWSLRLRHSQREEAASVIPAPCAPVAPSTAHKPAEAPRTIRPRAEQMSLF